MRLNIYCGLRAIGWIVTNGNKAVQYGIKRLNISFDNYYEYIAGLPVSKRINRRLKRGSRKNLHRYKRRREKLINSLKKMHMWSDRKYSQKEILHLRALSAVQPIDRKDLGAVFKAISAKRGYKSMRGASMSDASEYLKTIATHEENLTKYPSIGAYFQSLKSLKDVVLLRETYEREFHQICKAQNLTEQEVQALHSVIFHQRPIKQNNTSYCKVERRKVCHASHPLFQKFRCLRDANNIIVWDEEDNEVEIPHAQRLVWADKLYQGINLTKASVCKDLGIKKSTGYSWLSGKSLLGYELHKLCKSIGLELTEELWQDLFSATDDVKLEKLLLTKYLITKEQAEMLCEADIHAYGWAEYSQKAIKKLLPEMERGIKLSEAVLNLYDKVEMKEVALRNLVLEQHYYAMQSLVERLKQKYPIEEMNFEIDMLLKMGNKARKQLSSNRRKDLALKKQYAKELEGKTEYEFQKLKAWLELKGNKQDQTAVSPLEPDVEITLEMALSDKYNFDHIVPKSQLFERGQNNLILCRKSVNEDKGKKTAYDYAKEKGFLDAYLEISDRFSEGKKQLLKTEAEKIPSNAVTAKQNQDYNTKCFATLFEHSVNVPNKVILFYSREWLKNLYSSDDARYALQKAWVLSNFTQGDLEQLDNIKEVKQNPYGKNPNMELIDFEKSPIFLPRIKHTRKCGNTVNPRARLHEDTIFGKRILDGKQVFKCRKPLQGLTDKTVRTIMDKGLQSFLQREIERLGGLEKAKGYWAEHPPVFNGNELKSVSYCIKSNTLKPLKMKEGVKVDYVLHDAKHRLELNGGKKKSVSLMDFLNEPYSDRGFYLQANNIVEIDGRRHYLLGASEAPKFREVYTLNANDTIRATASTLKGLVKIEVNQLGEEIRRYGN
ncbi:type II CRISPR RNA-guided endonuclease Cas9 [Riemerella columbipharyngis]|uniref:HNH endonuclease n=1 Tax=Riemerella columbipharyngis TaxID=1071918 RepID=A0A1G7FUP3_9FLAO|nr:type II CRISPR RNA-guided endonuclease Cas9 [Riemerella columbipharyngis]SDE79653.1 HNH endonuclease [Riemerella columbipharyngis]